MSIYLTPKLIKKIKYGEKRELLVEVFNDFTYEKADGGIKVIK